MEKNIQNNFVFQQASATNAGTLGFIVPESIIRQNLLSPTSEALYCFVGQQFSQKLQSYMINYVIATNSFYPLYG